MALPHLRLIIAITLSVSDDPIVSYYQRVPRDSTVSLNVLTDELFQFRVGESTASLTPQDVFLSLGCREVDSVVLALRSLTKKFTRHSSFEFHYFRYSSCTVTTAPLAALATIAIPRATS